MMKDQLQTTTHPPTGGGGRNKPEGAAVLGIFTSHYLIESKKYEMGDICSTYGGIKTHILLKKI